MTHFYEKNIVEIKNEYTTYLVDVLIPLIYEGIQSTYNYATEQCEKLDALSQTNQNIKNPGVLKIFQSCLKEIPSLSAAAIETETNRIKEYSRCSEWFDDLVKAVIKSYIVLLTYNATGKTCKLVDDRYHEKINVNEFIHKCYIECSVVFFNNPELMWTGHNNEMLQTCKTISYNQIRQSILNAIQKMLPIKLILQEYLSNDYIVEPPHVSPPIRGGDLPENGFGLLEHDDTNDKRNDNLLIVSSTESEHNDVAPMMLPKNNVDMQNIEKQIEDIKNDAPHENAIENKDEPKQNGLMDDISKHSDAQNIRNIMDNVMDTKIEQPDVKPLENIRNVNEGLNAHNDATYDMQNTNNVQNGGKIMSSVEIDNFFEKYLYQN